jgi:hypothetical protein
MFKNLVRLLMLPTTVQGGFLTERRMHAHTIPGTSREVEKTQTGEAIGKAYTVVLDDGRIVKIDGSLMGSLEAGRRVLVQENITLIFQRKPFSFVRYLEEKQ